jgi:pro-kumamolisin-like protein/Big-like domain-containing protein
LRLQNKKSDWFAFPEATVRHEFPDLRSTLLAAATIVFMLPSLASAQANTASPRITAQVDETKLTTLRGNTHPFANTANDRGEAPGSLLMERMLLVLERGSDQESALELLMEQQQDASSPNFHKWLTPQQFGQQFGLGDQDVQTITAWLQSHGFQIGRVSNGRTVIEFSGNADQVRQAFHTTIHQYQVNGANYWANSSDPQIPSALTPVVAGINTLYNFPRQPMHRVGGQFSRSNRAVSERSSSPSLFTFGGQTCGVPGTECYGLGPYDFATIYNVTQLWAATPTHIDGSGVTIAVVGESDVTIQDIRDFRNIFGLAAKDPQVIVDGPDPGTVPGDETESDLDLEWSGGVAKGATIDFVISQTTSSSLGVDLSAQYIVDNNLAPVLSESYGICELFLGTTGNQFFSQLWQQAAAQGITALVATGDSGSAVCDRNAGTQGPAQFGLSVNGFSSTPYNIAVGGTDFNDLTNPSTYWSATNSVPPGAPVGTPATVSALSYIPETTWNNTCTNAVFGNLLGFSPNAETNCNNPQLIADGFDIPAGGSGGKSNCINGTGQNPSSCTQGHTKPAWQTALTPSDGARDVPDVSMYAAVGGPSGAFYLICAADLTSAGDTSCDASDPNTVYISIGGTSASTPVFAGIMALVNQATGSRQGNAANVLYNLAGQTGNTCNSSNGGGTNCVFYDTTNGTIAMPCASGSPNCVVNNQVDSVGVLSGYATTTGYDLATGLGSVNANNLVTKWKNVSLTPSSTTLSLNSGAPINITHGQSVNVNIGVTGTGGTPSGNASLIANTGPDGTEGVQGFTLASGSASGSTNALPGGSNYTVFAQYAGDGTFRSSTSSPVTVNVTPEASQPGIALELSANGQQTNPNATTAPYGSQEILRMNVTSKSGDACAQNAPGNLGCPSGNVTITNNGTPLDGGTFTLNILGYAEDRTVQLPGGVNNLTLSYPGDNSFNASSTNSTITITPDPTTTVLEDPTTGILNTAILLAAAANGSGLGVAPSGTLTFFTGPTQLGSPVAVSAIVGSQTGVPSSGASVTTTQLALGNNSITAKYSGDSNYAPSTSAAATIDVQILTTLTVRSSNPISSRGSNVTFTATITVPTNQPAPTGSVNFFDASGTIGTATVMNGAATITTSSLPGGEYAVLATYSGDVNYAGVTSTVNETVNLLSSTTAVTASSSTVQQGLSVTFTATVSPTQAGGPTPSGSLQFFSNGTGIGLTSLNASGQAQLTTTSLSVGSDQITAAYGGDQNYSGSMSPAITETVSAAPTFTITANPTTVNVSAPGQSGSTTLTFMASNGFSSNGAVTISPTCTGLPSESGCSSGASVTIPANGTATATLMFSTTAPSALAPLSRYAPVDFNRFTPLKITTLACIFWVSMLLLTTRRKRQRGNAILLLIVCGFVVAVAGCGGGGPPPITNPGTPVGQANVVVTATINGVTENVSITLNVQ